MRSGPGEQLWQAVTAREPAQLRDAALVRRLLGPALDDLLGTADLALLDARLRHLAIDEDADQEREDLEALIDKRTHNRPSWWEHLRRLVEIAIGAVLLGSILVLLLCFASPWLGRILPAWLDWPPSEPVFARIAAALVAALLGGVLVSWLHLRDTLHQARIGLRAAPGLELATWPGIPVESPFARLASVWGCAGSLMLLAAALVVGVGRWQQELGALDLLLALLLAGVGLWWLVLAWQRRRVNRLVERTLFVGRV